MGTEKTSESAPVDAVVIRVGSQIKFAEDEQPYTIRAASRRYGICTRPFMEQDREDFKYDGGDEPPVYTIIDWDDMVRGRHNLIFNPFDFESERGCVECLAALEAGECELSQRTGGRVPLVLSE